MIEYLAAATGLVCVWLNARKQVWGWVIGLVSVGLYAWVFWQARLYADAALQGVFAVSSLYGLWAWSSAGAAPARRPISTGGPAEWALLALLAAAATMAGGYCLSRYTDHPRPWLDAALTAGSLAAQYQLAHKRVENWLVWLVLDAVYVGLYLEQGLYPTAALFACYMGLAAWAYRGWKSERTSATAGMRANMGRS